MSMKWIGLCVAGVSFGLLPACAVSSEADETEQTGAAASELVAGGSCTRNSQCGPDEWCLQGECKRVQQYPDPPSFAPLSGPTKPPPGLPTLPGLPLPP